MNNTSLLERCLDVIKNGGATYDIGVCIEDLEAAIAEQAKPQEPVAWMRPSGDGCDSNFRDHSTVLMCIGNDWTGWVPLYPRPQARE